jgi:peptidoglycan/LPS O-acetylase OafA/YrhL
MQRMKYFPEIDGLRAIAIVSVVIFHMNMLAHGGNWLPNGWAGVDIFFVISGYLITKLLLEEWFRFGAIDYRKFYIRRALRLFPALAALLVVVLLFGFFIGQFPRFLWAAFGAAFYMTNWMMAFNWGAIGWLAHTWSLSLEEQFYLAWPLLLPILGRRRLIVKILVLVALVIAWRTTLSTLGVSGKRIQMGFDTHADSLLIGCAVAAANIPYALRRLAALWSPAPAIALIFLLANDSFEGALWRNVSYTIFATLSAWLLVAAMEEGWLATLLRLPWLRYTGRVSYGWYLWHLPLLLFQANYDPQTPILLYAMASYLIAALSFRWVEAPFLAIKSRYTPLGQGRGSFSGADEAANAPLSEATEAFRH